MPLSIHQINTAQSVEIRSQNDVGEVVVWPSAKDVPVDSLPMIWGLAPGLVRADSMETCFGDGEAVLNDLQHRLHQAKIQYDLATFISKDRKYQGVLMRGISRTRAVALGYKLRQWVVFGLNGESLTVVYTGLNSHRPKE